MSQEFEENTPSNLKILISSDNHVGYKEDHPIRGQDSFNAFEEVLKRAKEEQADFVLLGGDLFHEQNPSQSCLTKTVQIFQKYVLGDGDINFGLYNYFPNYSDDNLNIDLPVFIIHGNHDYPVNDLGDVSVLDMFHAAKYLNYFGKNMNSKQVIVKPLLFEKVHKDEDGNVVKTTKVALYGIGNMKEAKLNKLFQDKQIIFEQPENSDDFFNILIVHQNRFKGTRLGASYKQTLQEKLFPNFINLVIWGNEHECKAQLEESNEYQYQIYQPGSTVVTSLIEGEMKPKGYGILNIDGSSYNFQQKYLKEHHRPLFYDQLQLYDVIEQLQQDSKRAFNQEEESCKILRQHIQDMLDEYKKQYKELAETKPLIRLKVEYQGLDLVRVNQIEQEFSEEVANPGEIMKFQKRKVQDKDMGNFEENKNLNENFVETISGKQSFNVLGSETHQEIMVNYSNNIQTIQPKIFSGELVVDLFGTMNQKQRNTQIDKTFSNVMDQVEKKIQEQTMVKNKEMNNLQDKKMGMILGNIEKNLSSGNKRGRESISQEEIDQTKNYDYKQVAIDRVISFKNNVKSQILDQVSQLYKEQGNKKQQNDIIGDIMGEDASTQIQNNQDIDLSDDDQDQQQQFKKFNGFSSDSEDNNNINKNQKKGRRAQPKKQQTKIQSESEDEFDMGGKKQQQQKKKKQTNNQKKKNNNLKSESESEEEIVMVGKKQNNNNKKQQNTQSQFGKVQALKPVGNTQKRSSKASQGNQSLTAMFAELNKKNKKK